jgi:diaminopimelate decarboxylase
MNLFGVGQQETLVGSALPTVWRLGDAAPTPGEYRRQPEGQSPDLFAADVRLATELGRAIHANCSSATSRVAYVKPAQRLAAIRLGAELLRLLSLAESPGGLVRVWS